MGYFQRTTNERQNSPWKTADLYGAEHAVLIETQTVRGEHVGVKETARIV
jgi:hypothetical protein